MEDLPESGEDAADQEQAGPSGPDEPTLGPSMPVALAALKREDTLAELARQYDLRPDQNTAWKAHMVEAA